MKNDNKLPNIINEFEFYNPDAPSRFWPKYVTGKFWQFEAYISKTSAILFNASTELKAIKFAKNYRAYSLFNNAKKVEI